MLQQLQALVAQGLAYAKAYPYVFWPALIMGLGYAARQVRKSAAPGSKLYHFADAFVHLLSNVVDFANAMLKVFGKKPMLVPVVDADKTPVPGTEDTDPGRPSALKALLFVAAAAAMLGALAPGEARAQGFLSQLDWSVGPSASFFEYEAGKTVDLTAGLGMQVSVTHDYFKREFLGKSWDMLDLDLMAFGPTVDVANGQDLGKLTLAGAICTASNLFCLGGGKHILDANGNFTGRSGWMMLFAMSVNFGTSPSAPPTGVAQGAAGLTRANTLYFGSP